MSQSLQEVLDAARQLPPDEQRELASKLLAETARHSLHEVTSNNQATAAQILADIAALPLEGKDDPFSGADHDTVLYPKDEAAA